jgi:hypothetical protein
MGRAIAHFMWGYQPHFRIGKECEAEAVFKRLDDRLRPAVFLVGILADPAVKKWPACVEPEDDFWIESAAFDGVAAIAAQLVTTYPEAGMFQSHPLAQQYQDEDLAKRSIRDAMSQVIQSHPAKPTGMRYQVSYPARVESYWVAVVLGLQETVLNAYPSLHTSHVAMHEHRHIPVPVSLLDAVAAAFLGQATHDLLLPNPGEGSINRDPEELLRSAADALVTGIVWRTDQHCIEGMHGLCRSLTTLASLRYEKAAGTGRILIARRDHPSVTNRVSFATPTTLRAHRSVRKLLELSSDELPLSCDPERAYGLAERGAYDPKGEDLFEVRFLGHHRWELRHANQLLMRVEVGLPSLPKLPFNEEKLRTDLPRIFKGITPTDVDRLVALIGAAEKESHGTLLVITEAAESEARRLAPQGTPVTPFQVTADTLPHLTPIDGALILDPTGVCHAIGTILDGQATENGDPGRGARYNSAVRYYESADAPCLLVVVSSDGGIDLVPNPPPAIRRAAIDEAINGLRELADDPRLNWRRYHATLDWLDEHRFYLMAQDCDILNKLVADTEERIRHEDQAQVCVVRRPFAPSPHMNELLYYLRD